MAQPDNYGLPRFVEQVPFELHPPVESCLRIIMSLPYRTITAVARSTPVSAKRPRSYGTLRVAPVRRPNVPRLEKINADAAKARRGWEV